MALTRFARAALVHPVENNLGGVAGQQQHACQRGHAGHLHTGRAAVCVKPSPGCASQDQLDCHRHGLADAFSCPCRSGMREAARADLQRCVSSAQFKQLSGGVESSDPGPEGEMSIGPSFGYRASVPRAGNYDHPCLSTRPNAGGPLPPWRWVRRAHNHLRATGQASQSSWGTWTRRSSSRSQPC